MSISKKGMSGHQRPVRGATDTWLTPPGLIEALGPFDLDPCCPPTMPWSTAAKMIHWPENGLAAEWSGRVWLNPPYGAATGRWLRKLAEHNNGIALIFARTETADFHAHVWSKATALLFLRGRLHFHHANGKRAKANAGAPSVLVAYGATAAMTMRMADLTGQFIALKDVRFPC